MAEDDVLVITAVDSQTQRSLARAATALQASTPALTRHVLTGVAPLLAQVAQGQEDATTCTSLDDVQIYARLIQGEVMVGQAVRCPLTPEAIRVHEGASQQVARAYALLDQSRHLYAEAHVAVERAKAGRAGGAAVSQH